MKIEQRLRRRIRTRLKGVAIASDVNVATAPNVGERGAVTKVTSRQADGEADDKRGK